MTAYISLLRGINVAGQKKILMKDLKALYETLGFSEVSTYIQSGNVVFFSELTAHEIQSVIQQKIQQHYGFEVPVLVLSETQLKRALSEQPYTDVDLEKDGSKMMFSFLSELPTIENINKLMAYVKLPERLDIFEKVLYLHCPNGYGKTKLSNNFVEQKLKLTATTRNLKTVTKLVQMLADPS